MYNRKWKKENVKVQVARSKVAQSNQKEEISRFMSLFDQYQHRLNAREREHDREVAKSVKSSCREEKRKT